MMNDIDAIKYLKYLLPLNVNNKPINKTTPTMTAHAIRDSTGRFSMYLFKSDVIPSDSDVAAVEFCAIGI